MYGERREGKWRTSRQAPSKTERPSSLSTSSFFLSSPPPPWKNTAAKKKKILAALQSLICKNANEEVIKPQSSGGYFHHNEFYCQRKAARRIDGSLKEYQRPRSIKTGCPSIPIFGSGLKSGMWGMRESGGALPLPSLLQGRFDPWDGGGRWRQKSLGVLLKQKEKNKSCLHTLPAARRHVCASSYTRKLIYGEHLPPGMHRAPACQGGARF